MPSVNQSQINDMIRDNAQQTTLLIGVTKQLEEAKAERVKLREDLDALLQWRASVEAAEVAKKEESSRTHKALELVFKIFGVLATLAGAAWALIIRGEHK